jgi:hypothetical protein
MWDKKLIHEWFQHEFKLGLSRDELREAWKADRQQMKEARLSTIECDLCPIQAWVTTVRKLHFPMCECSFCTKYDENKGHYHCHH